VGQREIAATSGGVRQLGGSKLVSTGSVAKARLGRGWHVWLAWLMVAAVLVVPAAIDAVAPPPAGAQTGSDAEHLERN